jgi:hypothetical protein
MVKERHFENVGELFKAIEWMKRALFKKEWN